MPLAWEVIMIKIVLFVTLIGWVANTQSAEQPNKMMNHAMPMNHEVPMGNSMEGMEHDHQPALIPEHSLVPQIELQLHRDDMSGFNLHLKLVNFNVGPPEFEKEIGKIVEGHAHLYINGEKIQRIYGRYIHLPQELFKEGVNMVMVSLNAHNHNVWTYGDKQILASTAIMRDAEKFQITQFSSSPIVY